MKKIPIISILLIVALLLSAVSSYGQPTIGLLKNTDESLDGYTLFTADSRTYLIDNCGRQVRSWQSELRPGLTAYLAEDGSLIRAGIGNLNLSGPGGGGTIEKYNWEGDLLWTYDLKDSTGIQHHDIEPLPNGNVLAIAWEIKTQTEAIQAGDKNDNSIWPLVIFEIEPVGTNEANIVWKWNAWDHLIQDFDMSKDNFGVVSEHPELIDINATLALNGGDWLHANSIDYNPERDEILISARHTSEIYIIDHSTTTEEAASHSGGNRGKGGDILYRWGNPQIYGRGTVDDQSLFRQHDAQWIPKAFVDEGKISIFNNGAGRQGGDYSSVDVIVPPIDNEGNYTFTTDAPYGPQDFDWTYTAQDKPSFFLPNMGGAERLSNGNTLITESNAGRFLEVDLEGNEVWEYISPISITGPLEQGSSRSSNIAVFRASRYAPNFPGFIGRDLTPGEPVELNPLPVDCTIGSTSTIAIADLDDVYIQGNLTNNWIIIRNPQSKVLQAEVFNFLGQQVIQSTIDQDYDAIDLRKLYSGPYLIRFTDSQARQSITYRLVKLDQ